MYLIGGKIYGLVPLRVLKSKRTTARVVAVPLRGLLRVDAQIG